MNTLISCTIDNPFNRNDECANFIIDDPLSSFTLHDIVENGKEYTLGFWIKGDNPSKFLVASNSISITTEWVRHVIVFTAKETNLDMMFQSNGSYYMWHSKLEKGNKATEWDLSVEDISYELDVSIAELHNLTVEENTTILETSKNIMLQAMKSYVERDNGIYITGVNVYYISTLLSTISDLPTDIKEWVTDFPIIPDDGQKYNVWVQEEVIYSDETVEHIIPRIICNIAYDNTLKITNYYASYSNGESITIGDDAVWVSEVPVIGPNEKYLWKYEMCTYSAGTITTDPRLIGTYKMSYQELQEQTETKFNIVHNKIDMSFESTTKQIEDLKDDVNQTITNIKKNIEFSEKGIIIRSGLNAIELQLDNDDGIIFSKNGVPFGTWDGVNFHTGNIVIDVEKRAQFGNFAFIPRSDKSLMFLKVGDS